MDIARHLSAASPVRARALGLRYAAATRTPARSLTWTVTSTIEGLQSLEAEWSRLSTYAPGATRVFFNFNWVWHWCNHYFDAKHQQLAVVTGRHLGRLVLIWPLVVERHAGLRIASFLGAPVGQYGDVLVDTRGASREAWIDEAWDCVRTDLAPDLLHLRKVREDSAIAGLLRRIGAEAGNRQSAPFIGLDDAPNLESFEQRYGAKDRKNRRRKRKRLGEQGSVGFRRSSGSDAALQALTTATTWKRQWLETGAKVSNALADQRFDRFFEAVLTSKDRPVEAEAFELTLDGRPIAIKIALTSGAYRGMHFTSYDNTYEKCGPGGLLVEAMIEAAIADGVKTLDFLAPAYPYKLEWATGSVGTADYAFARSATGKLYHGVYVQRLRPGLQWLISEAAPVPVRRVAAWFARLVR